MFKQDCSRYVHPAFGNYSKQYDDNSKSRIWNLITIINALKDDNEINTSQDILENKRKGMELFNYVENEIFRSNGISRPDSLYKDNEETLYKTLTHNLKEITIAYRTELTSLVPIFCISICIQNQDDGQIETLDLTKRMINTSYYLQSIKKDEI